MSLFFWKMSGRGGLHPKAYQPRPHTHLWPQVGGLDENLGFHNWLIDFGHIPVKSAPPFNIQIMSLILFSSRCSVTMHRTCVCVNFIAEHTRAREDSTKVNTNTKTSSLNQTIVIKKGKIFFQKNFYSKSILTFTHDGHLPNHSPNLQSQQIVQFPHLHRWHLPIIGIWPLLVSLGIYIGSKRGADILFHRDFGQPRVQIYLNTRRLYGRE